MLRMRRNDGTVSKAKTATKEREDAIAARVGQHIEARGVGMIEGFAWCIVHAWQCRGYKAAKAMAHEAVRRFGPERLAAELERRHMDPTKVIE